MDNLTNIIVSTLGSTALTAISKGPTETLSQWWYYNFGYKNEHKYLQRKQEVENQYKLEISKQVTKIPEQNIQEPKMNILGPSLEASKYYIEDKELRLIFAKLVASSMDSSKNNIAQPAFVEIVKQMTPLDAQNLMSIYSTKNGNIEFPIVSVRIKNSDTSGFSTIFENLYLNNCSSDYYQISSSLINLQRLGIINIDYSKWFVDETMYYPFKNTYIYKEAEKRTKMDLNLTVDLQKGIVSITTFGLDFCKVCL